MPTEPTAAPPPLHEVLKKRKKLVNVSSQVKEQISPLTKVAMWTTEHVGTPGFFLAILTWTVIWLSWNLLAPARLQFDPPMGFVLWLFLSNLIQILLMPLIMVGQNMQGKHSDARAENDLEVNIKAEQEIEAVLRHLEFQNTMLLAMVTKLGIDLAEAKRNSPT